MDNSLQIWLFTVLKRIRPVLCRNYVLLFSQAGRTQDVSAFLHQDNNKLLFFIHDFFFMNRRAVGRSPTCSVCKELATQGLRHKSVSILAANYVNYKLKREQNAL
jgi:hypothetical protein